MLPIVSLGKKKQIYIYVYSKLIEAIFVSH